MANDGSVVIGTELDDSGFRSGLQGLGGVAIKGLSLVGTAIGAGVAATVALGKASVETGMQFDSAMSQVAATMGLTTDEIGDLRQYALDMGSTTAFSATEAAEALNYMALAGYDSEKSMAMLPNVLNLAAAGNMNLASASDMVTDAQSALGLSMKDTEKLVDQMAKTSSKSNTSVSQLGDAILTVGGTAKSMAGGTTELNQVLGILADNGIKGAEGGTALRNMILSLSAPTDKAAKKMKELGLEVFDASGNMRPFEEIFADLNTTLGDMTEGQKTQVLNELFNKVDLKSVNALLGTNAGRWKELKGAINDADGAARQMAEIQLDNLAGDVTLFESALEGAKIAISDSLTPALREFVQFGTEEVGKLSDAFQEGGLKGFAEQLGESLGDAIDMLGDYIPDIVEAGATLALSLAESIGSNLVENFPTILRTIIDLAGSIGNALVEALPGAMAGIGQMIGDLIADIPYMIQVAGHLVEGFVEGFIQGLPGLASGVAEGLVGFISGPVSTEVMNAQKELENLKKDFSKFREDTQKDIEEAFAGIDSQAAEAEAWLAIFDELKDKTNLTTEEQLKLNEAVAALNSILPETSQLVQDESGQWSMNTEEIRKNIEALKARAKAEVYQEKAKETMRKIVELQEQQTQKQVELNEAYSHVEECTQHTQALKDAHSDLNDALWINNEAGKSFDERIAGLSQSTLDWADANGIQLNSETSLLYAMAMLENQTAQATEAQVNAEQAADILKQQYDELGNQINTLNDDFEHFWEEAAEQKTIATETAQDVGESYSEGLKTTAKDAKEAGEEVLAAAAEGTNNTSIFSENGHEAGQALGDGIEAEGPTVEASGKELLSAAESGASGGNFYGIGYAMGSGVASGINASKALVSGAAGGVASAAAAAMRAVAMIHSPSRLTRDQVGIPMGEGVAVGLEESLGDIFDVLDDEISGAISEENRTLTSSGSLIDAQIAATTENTPRYVETNIEIDGRTLAKTTTPYISKELAWT